MASASLFGNRIVPACKYCRDGCPGRKDEYLCSRHGIVIPDHKCRYFFYDPLSRIPKRAAVLEKLDEEAFAVD